MPLEAGRCEAALPEITLDMYVTAATMEPGGVLSQVRRVQSKTRRLGPQQVMLHIVHGRDCFLDLLMTVSDSAQE